MCGNRKTEILNKEGHVIQVLITQLRIIEIHQKVYTAVCCSRKTEILNKVGHVIEVLVTQLRIKEIHRKVYTVVCVAKGKQRF